MQSPKFILRAKSGTFWFDGMIDSLGTVMDIKLDLHVAQLDEIYNLIYWKKAVKFNCDLLHQFFR